MQLQVIKRNGQLVPFDINKIYDAVTKAFESIGYNEVPQQCIEVIKNKFESLEGDTIGVEEIQDKVEQILYDNGFIKVWHAYSVYRAQRKSIRDLDNWLDYMESYKDSSANAAASSATDPNANVAIKNVANLEGEVYKPTNRLIQRRRMQKYLKKLYPGQGLDIQYIKDIEHHTHYPHDEASTPVPKNYCEANSMYPIHQGRGVGDMDGVTPKPPKWLRPFCGQFNNLVFLLSAQCKGAVAFGELFNFLDRYCAKEFGESYPLKEDLMASSEHVRHRQTIGDQIDEAFEMISFYLNQPAGNRSYQSPFSNVSYYDENYWKALFSEFKFVDGTSPEWWRVNWLQKRYMKWLNHERTEALLTFPVETMALLTDGKDIIDKDYKDFTAQMLSEGHSFFLYLSNNPNGLASCCRLRNEIEENEFSFTNGLTGVMTGSCNVISLNMNRIIQDFMSQDCKSLTSRDRAIELWQNPEVKSSFKFYLIDLLERTYKYHIAYKTILYDWEKAGMFTASNAGYIHMNKLFSTIGLNGINEAARYLGLEVSYNKDYQEFCNLVTGTIKEENKKHSTKLFKFNTELVPAEGLSSKNYGWDKEDGYWVPEDTKIYNSYFYNAWNPNTSILEKIALHGEAFTSCLDGGVGLHLNLENNPTKEQCLKIINAMIELGCTYGTINVPQSECTNPECHFIVKHPMDVCPKCGAPMRKWERVVGFLRPVDNYDPGRFWDWLHRHHHNTKKE